MDDDSTEASSSRDKTMTFEAGSNNGDEPQAEPEDPPETATAQMEKTPPPSIKRKTEHSGSKDTKVKKVPSVNELLTQSMLQKNERAEKRFALDKEKLSKHYELEQEKMKLERERLQMEHELKMRELHVRELEMNAANEKKTTEVQQSIMVRRGKLLY